MKTYINKLKCLLVREIPGHLPVFVRTPVKTGFSLRILLPLDSAWQKPPRSRFASSSLVALTPHDRLIARKLEPKITLACEIRSAPISSASPRAARTLTRIQRMLSWLLGLCSPPVSIPRPTPSGLPSSVRRFPRYSEILGEIEIKYAIVRGTTSEKRRNVSFSLASSPAPGGRATSAGKSFPCWNKRNAMIYSTSTVQIVLRPRVSPRGSSPTFSRYLSALRNI